MRRLWTCLLLAALAASPAFAGGGTLSPFGCWRNDNGNFVLLRAEKKNRALIALRLAGGGDCTGAIEGEGQLDGNIFTLHAPDDSSCILSIELTWKKAFVMEDHCDALRGASCEFSGAYLRATELADGKPCPIH